VDGEGGVGVDVEVLGGDAVGGGEGGLAGAVASSGRQETPKAATAAAAGSGSAPAAAEASDWRWWRSQSLKKTL
jgi:hypothetical protein